MKYNGIGRNLHRAAIELRCKVWEISLHDIMKKEGPRKCIFAGNGRKKITVTYNRTKGAVSERN